MKVIRNRFWSFLNIINLKSENQFGFINNKETKNAITLMTEFICEKLDENRKTLITPLNRTCFTLLVQILLFIKVIHNRFS